MQEQLSLRWLYEQKSLQLKPYFTVGASFRVIAPTELEDPTEFLAPSSIVLTLGLSFLDRGDQWDSYVARLAGAGVAAIGFGTGLGHVAIPEELQRAAKMHRVELFEVPRQIPFVSIIRAAHDEFVRRDRRATESLLELQEKLNRVALSGGIQKVLQEASQLLKAGLCVIDNDRRIIGAAAYRNIDARPFSESLIAQGFRSSRVYREDGMNVLAQQMLTQGERFHLLVAVSEKPIPAAERSAIRHCSGLLDILIQRPQYLRTKQAELNTMALSILLGAEGSQQAIAPVFAHVADADDNVRPVVITADSDKDMARAMACVNSNLESTSRGSFSIELRPRVVAFLFRGTRRVPSVITMFGESKDLIRIAIGAPLSWRNLSMETFQELEMRAKTVAIGEVAGPADGVLRWTQDRHVQSLMRVRNDETYGRLANYDIKNKANLTETLSTFLKCGGHVGNTASNLGVHRHTIRTRIQKIAEICECDLENPVTRAELLLVYVSRGSE